MKVPMMGANWEGVAGLDVRCLQVSSPGPTEDSTPGSPVDGFLVAGCPGADPRAEKVDITQNGTVIEMRSGKSGSERLQLEKMQLPAAPNPGGGRLRSPSGIRRWDSL